MVNPNLDFRHFYLKLFLKIPSFKNSSFVLIKRNASFKTNNNIRLLLIRLSIIFVRNNFMQLHLFWAYSHILVKILFDALHLTAWSFFFHNSTCTIFHAQLWTVWGCLFNHFITTEWFHFMHIHLVSKFLCIK